MINYGILRVNYNTEAENMKYDFLNYIIASLTRSFCVIYYCSHIHSHVYIFIYIKFNAENAMQTTKIIKMI